MLVTLFKMNSSLVALTIVGAIFAITNGLPTSCPMITYVIFTVRPNVDLKVSAPKLAASTNSVKNIFGKYQFSDANICEDGEPHTEGWYCSSGKCNIFGKNCDGPCWTNDKNLTAEEMFLHNYGEFVEFE